MKWALIALVGALALGAFARPAAAQINGTCGTAAVNYCGGYAASSGCWCDDACLVYRDCCSNRTDVCEIAKMSIQSVTPSLIATNYASTITISGSTLYESTSTAADVAVTVGGVGCLGITLGSQQITCLLAAAPPSTAVTVTTQWRTLVSNNVVKVPGSVSNTTALAFYPPSITNITPLTSPTIGGSTLTITGTNFGATGATVAIGGFGCPVTFQSHTSVRCTIPAGAGSNLPLTLTRGSVTSAPVTFSYTPPTLTSVTPSLLPTTGGVITLAGSNFGPSGAAVTIGGVSCPIQSQTHSQIVCTSQPGSGEIVPIQVSAAGYPASGIAFISYQPPQINGVTPTSGPAAGQVPLTITGTNFGTSGVVTIAGSACVPTAWTHTSIVCTTPPGHYASAVQVKRAGQLSNTATYSYLPPPVCSANQFVSGGLSCQACPAGTMSPGGSVTSCQPIVCPSPQVVNLATNSCQCPAAQPGYYITDSMTCATSPVAATLFLRAECVEPDPVMPGTNIVHFGYFNNYEPGGLQLPRQYGAGSNTVTVDGVDVGPASGAPDFIEYGTRNNVFALRYTPGQQIVWSVLDPVTNMMATASPAGATPACTTLVEGPMGAQGASGVNGTGGANGAAGPFGFQGSQGLAGPAGPQGDPGEAGAPGPQGPQGAMGPQGPQGDKGPLGDQGPIGLAGPQGVQGVTGPKGLTGDKGPDGPQGPAGAQGPQGLQGPKGPVGDQGPAGEKGATGDQGATGAVGAQGPVGASGPQGPAGAVGAIGFQGPQGPAGVVPAGFWLYLRDNEPAPSGYRYVYSYVEKLEKPEKSDERRDSDGREGDRDRKDDRKDGRDDKKDEKKDEKRDEKEIVIRVYQKNP